MDNHLVPINLSRYLDIRHRVKTVVYTSVARIGSELRENPNAYIGIAAGAAVMLYGYFVNDKWLGIYEVIGAGLSASGTLRRIIDKLGDMGILTEE